MSDLGQALKDKKKIPKFQRPRTKRTPAVIKKIANMVTKENPATYKEIKSKTDLALDTICKVIHEDLKLETRKKSKVHQLTVIQKFPIFAKTIKISFLNIKNYI